MKRPFQVGDRVAVYAGINRWTGTIVSHIKDTAAVSVSADKNSHQYYAHPKQCRRLVPKKRREIWCNENAIGQLSAPFRSKEEARNSYCLGFDRLVRFVEAKEKTKK